jgi:hypothetical protein
MNALTLVRQHSPNFDRHLCPPVAVSNVCYSGQFLVVKKEYDSSPFATRSGEFDAFCRDFEGAETTYCIRFAFRYRLGPIASHADSCR